MSVIAGASAAACFGVADFFAAGVSRSEGWRRTLLGAQTMSLPFLAIFIWIYEGWEPAIWAATWATTWVWVLGFGAAHLLGSVALYRGLEVGIVSVVSPLAGTFGAVTAVLAVASGATMTSVLALALASVVAGSMLAARSTRDQERGEAPVSAVRGVGESVHHRAQWVRGAGWGVLSALALGISFFGLDVLGTRGAPIALTVGSYRLITAVGLGVGSWGRGGASRDQNAHADLPRRWRSLARWTFLGVLDSGGMLVYAWGCARGHVAVVAVVASLFPALTVSLAQWRMGERLSRWQWTGLAWMLAGLCAVAWLHGR
jgi:drug/metabolite transporter (DMT)-like permease